MALAIALDSSDEDCIAVPCSISTASIDEVKRRRVETDEMLARRLQAEERRGESTFESDIALALELQHEEDRRREKHGTSTLVQEFRSKRTQGDNDALLAHELQSQEQQRASGQSNVLAPPPPELVSRALSHDLVSVLRRCLSIARDLQRSEVCLCGPTPFFHQHKVPKGKSKGNVERSKHSISEDRPNDNWSCGYRNVQMLIGHLLHREKEGSYSQLFGGVVPGVTKLQIELDRLWREGFDQRGCMQLGGTVQNTRKWIGTSEACVLLRGQGVRCNIEAFRGEAGADSAAVAVIERARKHFEVPDGSAGLVHCSDRPPLYLQHDGHSRTVVGVQRRREMNGTNMDFLLVLDPGLGEGGFHKFMEAASCGKGWEQFVKRSLGPLRRKGEYEVLVITPGPLMDGASMRAGRRIEVRV